MRGAALSPIATVNGTSFIDSAGLEQAVSYCYWVEALGTANTVTDRSNLVCTKLMPLPVQLTTQSSSYCGAVIATNTTTQPLDWQVVLTFAIPITITQTWNTTYTQKDNRFTFRGLDWNKTLQPGQSTQSVGFCATLGSILAR